MLEQVSSLVSQYGQWMQLTPERDHLILVISWVMIRVEVVVSYSPILKI